MDRIKLGVAIEMVRHIISLVAHNARVQVYGYLDDPPAECGYIVVACVSDIDTWWTEREINMLANRGVIHLVNDVLRRVSVATLYAMLASYRRT